MPEWEDLKPIFKWPIAAAQRIAAPAGKVWDTISMPGNLKLCHPCSAENPAEGWPGSEVRNQAHYLNGLVCERRFCRWIKAVGMTSTSRGAKDGLRSCRGECSLSIPGIQAKESLSIRMFCRICQWPFLRFQSRSPKL
jgi:hypothetical protein